MTSDASRIVAVSVPRLSGRMSAGNAHAIGTPFRETTAEREARYRVLKSRRILVSCAAAVGIERGFDSGPRYLKLGGLLSSGEPPVGRELFTPAPASLTPWPSRRELPPSFGPARA